MYSGHHRNQGTLAWPIKALAYAIAATVGGAVSGALLGWFGGGVPADIRIGLAAGAGLLGLYVGMREVGLGRRPPRLIERDRETSQVWMDAGPMVWALANGVALGMGGTSRIAFALWYVIPTGVFLLGSPLAGVLVYGLYGGVRGWLAWAVVLAPRVSNQPPETCSLALLTWNRLARRLTAGYLVTLSLVVVIVVGV